MSKKVRFAFHVDTLANSLKTALVFGHRKLSEAVAGGKTAIKNVKTSITTYT